MITSTSAARLFPPSNYTWILDRAVHIMLISSPITLFRNSNNYYLLCPILLLIILVPNTQFGNSSIYYWKLLLIHCTRMASSYYSIEYSTNVAHYAEIILYDRATLKYACIMWTALILAHYRAHRSIQGNMVSVLQIMPGICTCTNPLLSHPDTYLLYVAPVLHECPSSWSTTAILKGMSS